MGYFNVSVLVGVASLSRQVLFVVNDSGFFVSHRLPVAIAAKNAGYDVTIAAATGSHVEKITESGLNFISIPLKRRSLNIIAEVRLFFAIAWLFRSLKPDIVHLVTIKPVLYGGIAARLLHVPAVIYAISGMGYLFTNERGGMIRRLVEALYRYALRYGHSRVVLQNASDRETLKTMNALLPGHDVLIPGSGVDLKRFTPTPLNCDVPIIVLPARMLWDKGIGEFVAAAEMLRERGVSARFALVGECDNENPAAITLRQLQSWRDEALVEWWGYRQDMPAVYAMSCLVVLPSYREGLPKALAEAAAAGRAIITTDAAGCREVVEHGKNGLLVPVRDSGSLADAIQTLLSDKNRLIKMGNESRKIAEAKFDLHKIVDMHLAVYTDLLDSFSR